MHYDYTPITQRSRLSWPDGKRVALVFTFNLETWDLTKDSDEPYYAGGPAILPDSLPAHTADFPNYCWREYGQRVGIWRLYELFDAMGIQASCTTNAVTFERRREMVDACLERGWELLAHNYEQSELLTKFAHDIDAERDVIQRSIAMYEQYTGRRPLGWLSSSLRGTTNTCSILAAEKFKFYCDLMNDDQPYLVDTDQGSIVSTPYSNEINDFTLLTRRGHTTDEFRDILKEELTVLHEEGEQQARIMNVGLHPHVSGRAYRIRGLREFIEYAQSLPHVWWTTREAIADHYLANPQQRITVSDSAG
ncbi:MAG: polysaccharide deacetylase [Pseudomonadota bacterium]